MGHLFRHHEWDGLAVETREDRFDVTYNAVTEYARAVELGVADRVEFVHGDATGHVADEPVDLAACVGATWIGDGVAGTPSRSPAASVPAG